MTNGMSDRVHRILMGIGGLLAGIGGITGGTELIDPEVATWIAFIGGVCVLVANQVRIMWPEKTEP